ncbi:MAG: two-component regulator propeller domain-containing protein, partial [Chloroflexota bacterium]
EGLVNNHILSIAIDNEGNKWFGGQYGAGKFDGTTWSNYYSPLWILNSIEKVYAIATDSDGVAWAGSHYGLAKLDSGPWNYDYFINNNIKDSVILSVAIDENGHKWLGTYDGVFLHDGSTWTNFYYADGLAGGTVRAIAIDEEGNKWFGTNSGVSKFDGTTWTSYYKSTDGLVARSVSSIAIDKAGNKWFGTKNGVSKFDGTDWATYTTADGLLDNSVKAIVVDDDNNVWFGTRLGISKFDGKSWSSYRTPGLIDNHITAITVDGQGNKWFGADKGVSKFDDTQWQSYTDADGLASNTVNCIVIDDDENVWVGTSAGASMFDGNSWTTYTSADGLVANRINTIAVDPIGNKWFGTWYGASKFDGTTWTTYTAADGLASNQVTNIAVDADGHIWFGTYYNGVSKFDGTTWTTYTTADGLASNQVTNIAVDADGHIWFGTRNSGVSKFDGATWTTYTTADGLASNYVNGLAIDPKGNKWFRFEQVFGGVTKFDGTTWNTYTTANGLINNAITDIAIDITGDIWFGSKIGVSHFSVPESLMLNHTLGNSGSYLNLKGTSFPPNHNANLFVNGQSLEIVNVTSTGDFTITFDTVAANIGDYIVTTVVDLEGRDIGQQSSKPLASATTRFSLQPTAPLHPQDGDWSLISIPTGLAFSEIVYLPISSQQNLPQLNAGEVTALTFVVTSEADGFDANPGDGVCETASGNRICTLRAALEETNIWPGVDSIIMFSGNYDIADGILEITDDLTIIGAGATQTVLNAEERSQVLQIQETATVNIFDITIRNGRALGGGGGIENQGYLSLKRSRLINNGAMESVEGGGGLVNRNVAEIVDSEIIGNFTETTTGIGGGIMNKGGELTILNSTIAQNQTAGNGSGIYNEGGTVSIINSTVSSNTSQDGSGSIYNTVDGNVILLNTTIVSNTGSGVENDTGILVLENSLIAENSGAECVGTITSDGYNLSSDTSCNWTDSSNHVNANANFGPLKDNGGPVSTHTLLAGSPAIDAGNNLTCAVGDQRSMVRPLDGDDDNNAICDIGAVEYEDGAQLLIIDESTAGFYNEALGTILDGTQAQFPTPEDADLTFLLTPEPDLSTASDILGDWLTATDFPVNEHWQARSTIPTSWDINTETAIVYVVDVGAGGISNLRGDFGVDNGFFVWVNGEFKFGALDAGFAPEYEYRHIDLGSLPAGRNYIQILREDHGVATDWNFRIVGAIEE